MTDTKTEAARFREAASEHGKRVEAAIEQLCKAVKRNARDCGKAFRVAKDDIRKLTICSRPAPAPADLATSAPVALDKADVANLALGYLTRLLNSYAPQCEPLDDLLGVCSQIDNMLVGMRAKDEAVGGSFKVLDDEPDIYESAPVAVQVPEEWVAWARKTVDADGAIGKSLPSVHEDADIAKSILAASASEPAPEPTRSCMAKDRIGPKGFACTEPDGHGGDHVARGGDEPAYDSWKPESKWTADLRQAIAAEEERGADDPVMLMVNKQQEEIIRLRKELEATATVRDAALAERDQLRKDLADETDRHEKSRKDAGFRESQLREELEAAKAELKSEDVDFDTVAHGIEELGKAATMFRDVAHKHALRVVDLREKAEASGNARLRELRKDVQVDFDLHDKIDTTGSTQASRSAIDGRVGALRGFLDRIDRLLADPDNKHTSVDSGGGVDQPAAERGEDALREVAKWGDGRGTAMHAAVAELCRRELARGGAK